MPIIREPSIAKLDRRYRVTLSKEVLQMLGVKAGDGLSFVPGKGIVYVFPVKSRKKNG